MSTKIKNFCGLDTTVETAKDCGLHDITMQHYFSNNINLQFLIGDLASGAANVEQQREASEMLAVTASMMQAVSELEGRVGDAESKRDDAQSNLANIKKQIRQFGELLKNGGEG